MNTLQSDPFGIGSLDLETEFLSAADKFVLGLFYAQIVQQQPNLDVSSIGAGLATQIQDYQRRMKSQAGYFNTSIMPAYIQVFVEATNFYALVDAAINLETPLIRDAYTNDNAKASAAQAMLALSVQAGDINVRATKFAKSFALVDGSLESLAGEYQKAFNLALEELKTSAADESANIDKLRAEIERNINGIVAGAEKLGGAVTQLGIGC